MGTGVVMRTLSSRKDVPGGARLFLLQPLDVPGEKVKQIDFLLMSFGGGLKFGGRIVPEGSVPQ